MWLINDHSISIIADAVDKSIDILPLQSPRMGIEINKTFKPHQRHFQILFLITTAVNSFFPA